MDNFKDFTYDHKNFAKLPELMAETKRDLNLYWTVILDPAIQGNDKTYDAFTKGYQQNVFIRWPKYVLMEERHNPLDTPNDRDVMYGAVWPKGPVAFPDFLKNVTKNWWKDSISHLYHNLSIKFDAIWIVNNFQLIETLTGF
jgi:alpha-glucosidase (family GH31 glycosyl hydrolase)